MLTPKEIAYEVTKALDAKKGQNIRLLKIDRVSSLADYFLICTGTSGTHVKTLCDYAEYTLEQLGEQMLSREGHRGNSWELLDYGSIVVKTDIRTIGTSVFLGYAYNHSFADSTLFNFTARQGTFYSNNDFIAYACISFLGTSKNTDTKHFFSTAVVCYC